MSFLKAIGAWFAKVWKSLKESTAHVAVTLTQELKAALDTGVVGWLATIVEKVFPTTGTLPEEIVADLKKGIVRVLAVELAIAGIPDNATEADVLDFEQRVLNAFGMHDDKSKLYTLLASQIYGIVERHQGNVWTFAETVQAVEEAYQDFVADQQELVAAQG